MTTPVFESQESHLIPDNAPLDDNDDADNLQDSYQKYVSLIESGGQSGSSPPVPATPPIPPVSQPVAEHSNQPTGSLKPQTLEERARLQGWRPKEEFYGDPDMWRDAKEFLYYGSLLKENKKLEKMVAEATQIATQARDHGYKQALADLEKRKQAARSLGDFESYDKHNDEINKLKSSVPTSTQNEAAVGTNEDPFYQTDYYKRYEAQNPWYKRGRENQATDDDLIVISAARVISNQLRNKNPNVSLYEEAEHIHKTLREKGIYKDNSYYQSPDSAPQQRVAGVTYNSSRPSTTNSSNRNKSTTPDYVLESSKLASQGYETAAHIIKKMGGLNQDWKSYLNECKELGLIK